VGKGHDRFLRGSGLHFAGNPAFTHDHDSVCQAQNLGQFRRNDNDRLAFVYQFADQLVDFAFGADIDATRWLIENQDVRIADQPFGDDDLLLVAAGQIADQLADRRCPDIEFSTYWLAVWLISRWRTNKRPE